MCAYRSLVAGAPVPLTRAGTCQSRSRPRSDAYSASQAWQDEMQIADDSRMRQNSGGFPALARIDKRTVTLLYASQVFQQHLPGSHPEHPRRSTARCPVTAVWPNSPLPASFVAAGIARRAGAGARAAVCRTLAALRRRDVSGKVGVVGKAAQDDPIRTPRYSTEDVAFGGFASDLAGQFDDVDSFGTETYNRRPFATTGVTLRPVQLPDGGGMARILIVDDDADAADALGKFIQKAGHEVICAGDGSLALTHVLTQTPDVVVLDLLMPEMDGPTFLEVVRSYLRLQSLPVVVLTGLPESPMIERTQTLKVNAVLVKGKSSSADILSAVEQAVGCLPG